LVMLEIRHAGMDSTIATQQNYNEIYSSEGIRQLDSFYLWLISLLKAQPGKRLLDISCGEGRLVSLARQKGLHADGVDFAFKAIKGAIEKDHQSGWFVGDGEFLPIISESYDYVTHIGSLEHFQNPMAGIYEITRVIKSGGKACILLPNSYGLFGNIKHVVETGHIFDDGQPLQRYNTRKGWQMMLEAGKLSPYRIIKFERPWPRTVSDLTWYLRHPDKIMRLFISIFIPLNLGNCIVYLCKREA
jgi:SAM-dependent methyltransferase